MIAWRPFKRVPVNPSNWQFTTVNTEGSAWGYGFSFVQPPTQALTTTRAGDKLQLQGAGDLILTTPRGARSPHNFRSSCVGIR